MPRINLHLNRALKQCILTGHFTAAASENDTDKRRDCEPDRKSQNQRQKMI